MLGLLLGKKNYTTMKSTMIFPSQLKVLGLWMSVIGLLGLWFATSGGLINVFRILEPEKTWPDGSYPYPPSFLPITSLIGHASVALLVLGLVLFFFSREKDEYLYHVRLESLQFAVVWQLAATVLLGLYFAFFGVISMENALPIIITMGVAGFWLLFVLRYCYVVFFNSRKEN